eukprot:15433637-Alexandrium_andersonii.AAC.1
MPHGPGPAPAGGPRPRLLTVHPTSNQGPPHIGGHQALLEVARAGRLKRHGQPDERVHDHHGDA